MPVVPPPPRSHHPARPLVRGAVAAMLATAGACAARTPADARAAEVTERVREAVGPMVRSVTRMAPQRAETLPWCPRETELPGDRGYVLVIEERTVGATDAVVIARTLCRQSRVLRGSPPTASTLERFILQRRGGRWQVVTRELLEERTR